MQNQPGEFYDVAGTDLETLEQANWEIAARRIWKREPTYINGVANTLNSQPTTLTRQKDEIWRDKNLGLWICTKEGAPGSWKQLEPGIGDSFPTGIIPDGYLFVRRDQRFRRCYYDLSESEWVEIHPFRLSASLTFNFPSIAAGASATTTFSVPGASVGDVALLGLPSNPPAGISYDTYVSSANTVTIRSTNMTGAAFDPGEFTCNIIVLCY